MKLLFDENLSPTLVRRSASDYPGTEAIAELLEAQRPIIEGFSGAEEDALLVLEIPGT